MCHVTIPSIHPSQGEGGVGTITNMLQGKRGMERSQNTRTGEDSHSPHSVMSRCPGDRAERVLRNGKMEIPHMYYLRAVKGTWGRVQCHSEAVAQWEARNSEAWARALRGSGGMGGLSQDWKGDTRLYFLLAPGGPSCFSVMKKPDRQPISLVRWELLEKMRAGSEVPSISTTVGLERERSLSPSAVVTDLLL